MKTYTITFEAIDRVTLSATIEAETLEEAKYKALHESTQINVHDETFDDRWEHREFDEPLKIGNIFVLNPMTIEEDTNDN